jgi:O-antigen ligase
LTTCFSVKTIVTGIYYGFAVTVGLHAVLAVCFPLLGMGFMATIFNHHASIREASRCGSPGTFGHPNVLGTYASYYMMFFVSCAMAKYKMKESIMFSALAIFVIFLSGSRSALLAVFFGVLMLVVFYVLRRYSVLNPKIFLWGVVPTVVIIGLLFFFTPLSDMFSDTSNLDEMSTARLMHYYCATEIIKAHPWLGVGLNSHLKFLLADKTIDINAVFGAEYWMPEDFMFTNPIHNVWLSLLAELGIVGFTPIVVYVVNFFRTFKKKIKNSQSIFYTISVMTALGIISCLLVQGNSDWAPETPQVLNITILFLFLAGTTSYAGETEEIAASPDYLKL